ncbi:MAG: LacI family DNA-binding transcriptional regulator [Oscillospiraceae bacterium]|nr:LacI family DNA-binding transcriptional regulator [Oscillospiraceae bacterium]
MVDIATVKDIAEKVGVSATTVSIVLNGKSEQRGITKATQDKIYQVMKELGYQPNLSARRLRAGDDEPAVIAFFWPADFRLSILASFLNAYSRRIRETGFNCELVVQAYENDSLEKYASSLLKNTYNAVIVGACSQKDLLYLESLPLMIPVVLVNRTSSVFSTVNVDNDAIGHLAAQQFLDKGYQKLAVFSSGKQFIATHRRTEAFLSSCSQMGITIEESHIFQDDSTAEGGYRMAEAFCRSECSAQAVFCDYDAIAFGALKAFHERGILVPEELELLSIDVTGSELTTHSTPALSVIKMPTGVIGASVIDLLQEKLNTHNLEPVHIEIPPELIIRESFLMP